MAQVVGSGMVRVGDGVIIQRDRAVQRKHSAVHDGCARRQRVACQRDNCSLKSRARAKLRRLPTCQ